MSQASPNAYLNRLLGVISRSFPQYLRYSRPYVPPGRGEVWEMIEMIAGDQSVLADRITHMLTESDATIRTGEFPMEFTDTHDLNIDFLLKEAIAYQEQDVQTIAGLVVSLQAFPAAKALAEEALGMAKGHLESLNELMPAGSAAD